MRRSIEVLLVAALTAIVVSTGMQCFRPGSDADVHLQNAHRLVLKTLDYKRELVTRQARVDTIRVGVESSGSRADTASERLGEALDEANRTLADSLASLDTLRVRYARLSVAATEMRSTYLAFRDSVKLYVVATQMERAVSRQLLATQDSVIRAQQDAIVALHRNVRVKVVKTLAAGAVAGFVLGVFVP